MASVHTSLYFVRTFGLTTNSQLGSTMPGLTVQPAQTGGFYVPPQPLPLDFDRSRDARLTAYIFSPNNPGGAAGDVQLDGVIGYAQADTPPTDLLVTALASLPAAWAINLWRPVELLTAGGPAIPAGTLPTNPVLGIRIARNGPAAPDTYPSPLGLLLVLRLDYNRLCQFCDCG
jgi:hypothetical protein